MRDNINQTKRCVRYIVKECSPRDTKTFEIKFNLNLAFKIELNRSKIVAEENKGVNIFSQ